MIKDVLLTFCFMFVGVSLYLCHIWLLALAWLLFFVEWLWAVFGPSSGPGGAGQPLPEPDPVVLAGETRPRADAGL